MGSRARNAPVDELADFDISVYAETHFPYTTKNQWLSEIGKVWVCVPEKFDREGEIIPTRLVIFEGGLKVDFAFYGLHVLDELAGAEELDTDFQVLLDKDGATKRLKSPTFRKLKHARPTEDEFVKLISEFWFEACYVAKYLKRDELWLAKFIDGNLKKFLLRIIEWHEQAKHDWDYETSYDGKNMKGWVSADTWKRLHQTFGHFDGRDSWDSLFATMNLFRQLAEETAELLGFSYPEEVDRHITRFISQIRSDAGTG